MRRGVASSRRGGDDNIACEILVGLVMERTYSESLDVDGRITQFFVK
jgi:hypothetical protein